VFSQHPDARNLITFLSDPTNDLKSRSTSALLGKVILGYGLVDKIISIMGAPVHPKHRPAPRTRIDSPSTKIEKIIQILRDWTTVLPDAEKLFQKYKDDASISQASGTVIVQSGSVTAQALNNLSKSIQADRHAKWQTILGNIHTMAFLLGWYPKVWKTWRPLLLLLLNLILIIYSFIHSFSSQWKTPTMNKKCLRS
jgi:hypothetical protein